jgi:two-component system, LytTR family, response regulator
MPPIRTLIVDDEALGRERLRTLLAALPDVEVVGECCGGAEAITGIRRLDPDLVFLDVQMPGVDGFQVLAEIGAAGAPAVVFATAYDEFALRAFEANAVDYLLKPIGPARLSATVQRVRERLRGARGPASPDPRLAALLEGLEGAGGYRDRIAVRVGERFRVVRTDEVLCFEAAGNYVRIHTAGEKLLFRTTMAELERTLDPRRFLRIHRSTIVNADHVVTIEPWGLGEHLFTLGDGSKVTSSRRYRRAVRAAFGC